MGTTDPTPARLEALRDRQAAGEETALDVMLGVVEVLADIASALTALAALTTEPSATTKA